jgi:hypothetical protein
MPPTWPASDLLADGDRFGLRLSQPLRIDGGGFAMSLPTSFDYASMTPGYSIVRSSLVPRGRELDAELSYGRRWLANGWISGNLFTPASRVTSRRPLPTPARRSVFRSVSERL